MTPHESRRPDRLPGLPPELDALDAELSELRIHERPSFAPELEGELRRTARLSPPARRRRSAARHVLAAAAGVVLFVALTVPPARASLARAGATLVRLVASGPRAGAGRRVGRFRARRPGRLPPQPTRPRPDR